MSKTSTSQTRDGSIRNIRSLPMSIYLIVHVVQHYSSRMGNLGSSSLLRYLPVLTHPTSQVYVRILRGTPLRISTSTVFLTLSSFLSRKGHGSSRRTFEPCRLLRCKLSPKGPIVLTRKQSILILHTRWQIRTWSEKSKVPIWTTIMVLYPLRTLSQVYSRCIGV